MLVVGKGSVVGDENAWVQGTFREVVAELGAAVAALDAVDHAHWVSTNAELFRERVSELRGRISEVTKICDTRIAPHVASLPRL